MTRFSPFSNRLTLSRFDVKFSPTYQLNRDLVKNLFHLRSKLNMYCVASQQKMQELQYKLASLQDEHSCVLKDLYSDIHELQKRYTSLTNKMAETESCDLQKVEIQIDTSRERELFEQNIRGEQKAIKISKSELLERDGHICLLEQEIKRRDRIADCDLKQHKQEIDQMEVKLRQGGEDIAYLTAKLHAQRSNNHIQIKETCKINNRQFSPSLGCIGNDRGMFMPSPPLRDNSKHGEDHLKPRGGRRLVGKPSTNSIKTLEKIYGSNSSTALSSIPSEKSKIKLVDRGNSNINLQFGKLQTLENIYGTDSDTSLTNVPSNTNVTTIAKLNSFKPLPPINPKDKGANQAMFRRKYICNSTNDKSGKLAVSDRESTKNNPNASLK